MINIQKVAASTVLAIAAFTSQNIEVHAKMTNSILCMDDSIPGGKIPHNKKIIIGGKCEIISKIKGLEYALDKLMEENSQYKNMYVIILGRELKENHKISMDSSPYTDIYHIKVDFNEKSGMSTTTIEYAYDSSKGTLKKKGINS